MTHDVQNAGSDIKEKIKKTMNVIPSSTRFERMMLFTVWEISRDASTSVDIHM